MTPEDRTAEKLKGNNCLIKFKDGEELMLSIPEVNGTHDDASEWFMDAEAFMHGNNEHFPFASISVSRDTIKYIIKI